MTAPEITHLQAFVLFQLASGERKGKALRDALDREGIEQRVPTFHACIKRLVRDRFITARPVKASGGARGTETAYSLTAAGRRALKDVRHFYRKLEGLAGE